MAEPTRIVDWDNEKKRLECKKLEVEIEQASIAWWKRPVYIGSMIPLVLSALGLLTAWSKGYFSAERERLQVEVTQLEARRTDLLKTNQRLIASNHALSTSLAESQQQIDDIFIKLRQSNADARYTLGHLYEGRFEEARSELAKYAPDLPRDVFDSVDSLLGEVPMIKGMMDESFEVVNNWLAEIPASKEAKDKPLKLPGPPSQDEIE